MIYFNLVSFQMVELPIFIPFICLQYILLKIHVMLVNNLIFLTNFLEITTIFMFIVYQTLEYCSVSNESQIMTSALYIQTGCKYFYLHSIEYIQADIHYKHQTLCVVTMFII